jgi:hypothetical protein
VKLPQPGKREIRTRQFDGKAIVYRFNHLAETAMQWEATHVCDTFEEARAIAFPKKAA